MGTINYGTSYYFTDASGNRVQNSDITIGLIPCSNYSDEESGYTEFLNNNDYTEDTFDRYQYNMEQDESSMESIEGFLDNADIPFSFKVGIENGYYEGFYIKIEERLPWCFDDAREKANAQKDITALRKLLMGLLEQGLVVVYPGWCTGYASKAESRKEVRGFIRNLRRMVHDMDTLTTYERKQKRKVVATT